MARYSTILRNFHRARILVVGDIMLDHYLYGDVQRLSAEAPVAVVREQEHRYVLGGAGNVAQNIVSLGGKAYLAGVIGNDFEGQMVKKLCRVVNISTIPVVVDPRRPTTTKKRVMVQHHQLLRLDREKPQPLSSSVERSLLNAFKRLRGIDLVVISDYAKGAVTKGVLQHLIARFGEAAIIADFKPQNARFFRGIQVILPNTKEAYDLTGIHAGTNDAAQRLVRRLAADFSSSVVFKRGEHGMTIYDAQKGEITHIPTRAREVFDVTGAGDTVIAVMGLALASGATLFEAAEIANHAAGIVVELEGTAAATEELLRKRLRETKII
jgi:D-beta-D-heptose 7-phosphate kinase/D-beta-D-heptose 1-phosphate adenosyltransferase